MRRESTRGDLAALEQRRRAALASTSPIAGRTRLQSPATAVAEGGVLLSLFQMEETELQREKRALRLEIREELAVVDAARRTRCAANLAELLAGWLEWAESGILLSFLSLPSEIETLPIHLQAIAQGKALGLPRISGQSLVFHRVSDPRVIRERNRFGIREPDSAFPLIEAGSGAGALVLVPGLAFDSQGRRLGRGRGFYDRFLTSLPSALRVGVCFDFQLVERVPAGPADVPVDWIVTERRLLRATTAGRDG